MERSDAGDVASRVIAMATPMFVSTARTSTDRFGLLEGKTILIVEDEPLVALDLHAALRAAGASLIAATNAAEALRLIRRNEISAAVVDVNLGGDNCFAVCQALFHRSIPFLFHTGHREADVLKAWPEAPLIVKPAGHDELVACLAALAS
jgi:DNA-binding response OmpR family regulator